MIIREYQELLGGDFRCAIRADHYGKSFEHITNLVKQAKTDFPGLQDKDIEIVIYGGQWIKGVLGIEFNRETPIPDTYEKVRQLEYTLA